MLNQCTIMLAIYPRVQWFEFLMSLVNYKFFHIAENLHEPYTFGHGMFFSLYGNSIIIYIVQTRAVTAFYIN